MTPKFYCQECETKFQEVTEAASASPKITVLMTENQVDEYIEEHQGAWENWVSKSAAWRKHYNSHMEATK